MAKKSAGRAPAPPDPVLTAQAQAGLNEQAAETQARLNRVNERTPFGSVTYRATGQEASPFERIISLDPAEQTLLDEQRGLETGLATLGRTILDRVSPNLATPLTIDGEFTRVRDTDEVRDAILARMMPSLDQERERLETQLVNQGFTRGSEGFNKALDSHNRAVNDARLGAVTAAGAEQSRLFGLDQASRDAMIREDLLRRSQPLNEIAAILGTGQVTVPQAGAVPQVGVAPADITGPTALQYQAALNQFNQSNQNRRASLGGLFGLGGSVLRAGLGPGGFLL